MPRRKKLGRYPVHYWELVRKALSYRRVAVVFPTAQRADNFRRDLYNFREALRIADDRYDHEVLHLYRQAADKLSFARSGNTVIVHIPAAYAEDVANALEQYENATPTILSRQLGEPADT